MSEHPYGACLAPLEVAGAKSLASGELISCAQDCFRRVTACFPGELISCGGSETMLRGGPLRPQPVVLFDRAQYVSTGHAVPGHHVFILQIVIAFTSSAWVPVGAPRMWLLAIEHLVAIEYLGDRLAFIRRHDATPSWSCM